MSKAFAIAVLALAACAKRVPPPIPLGETPWCVRALLRDDAIVADRNPDRELVWVCVRTQHLCRGGVKRARTWSGWLAGVLAITDCEGPDVSAR